MDPLLSEPQSTKRLQRLGLVAIAWAVILTARLTYLQIYRYEFYRRLAQQQQQKLIEIEAPRGTIFDRTGQRLAMSLPVDSISINPMLTPDVNVASEILSNILKIDRQDLLQKMKLAVKKHRGFMPIKARITPQESQRLQSLKLDWIEFRPDSRRFYPNGSLAAHVIGAVNGEERGAAGLEYSLDKELRGVPGSMRVTSDVKKRGFHSELVREPTPGKDVTLTIDNRIQYIAERALTATVLLHRSKTGSLVVMNPKTGEILALANYPTFDPNEPVKAGRENVGRENLAVTTPFEPGSCFKVVTLSAALETTRLRPDSMINCGNGVLRLFGRVIHDHKSYSALSMADVLSHSSNIGAIQIGLQVGNERLYEFVKRFGFGAVTGVPLPAESAGVVRPLKRWIRSSIGSVAMGHEISTTTLQLAQACSVIANGGFLVKPRLVIETPKPGISTVVAAEEGPRRILKPKTAITMRQLMEGVVLNGTGRKARLIGYTSGGKTGTAQIFDHATRKYSHKYNASFVGFAPVTDPAVVVVVTVNGASGLSGYGGEASAPVFGEVAMTALRMLNVPKDLFDQVEPDDYGPVDSDDRAIAEFSAGPETQEIKASDAPVSLASSMLATPSRNLVGPRTPNLRGKTKRSVVEECSSLGMQVEFSGAGIARAQAPAPGTILSPGQIIKVLFEK